jgi:hypothetical protein
MGQTKRLLEEKVERACDCGAGCTLCAADHAADCGAIEVLLEFLMDYPEDEPSRENTMP